MHRSPLRSRARLTLLLATALCALAATPALASPGQTLTSTGTTSTPAAGVVGGAAAPASATTSNTTLPSASTSTQTTTLPATPPAKTTGTAAGNKATHATRGGGGISGGALLAAVIAALIALACVGWAVFRLGAFEPHWLLSWRHSLGEASFRASATWAEFTDWIRLGH